MTPTASNRAPAPAEGTTGVALTRGHVAEARSYIAALAGHARTFDASVEYEHVLLQLDSIHGGEVPPTTEVLTDRRDVLYTVAEAAIES